VVRPLHRTRHVEQGTETPRRDRTSRRAFLLNGDSNQPAFRPPLQVEPSRVEFFQIDREGLLFADSCRSDAQAKRKKPPRKAVAKTVKKKTKVGSRLSGSRAAREVVSVRRGLR
jgi:hypothetical protein